MGLDMSRLILVANRLPVSLDLSDGQVKVQDSVGGLATGMRGLSKQAQTSWVGWPEARRAAMNSARRSRSKAGGALGDGRVPVHPRRPRAFTRACPTASSGRYFTT